MLTQLDKLTNDAKEGAGDQLLTKTSSRRALIAGGLTAALAAATGVASAQSRLGGVKGNTNRPLPPNARPPGTGGFTRNSSGANNGGTSINRTWGDMSKRLLRRVTYGATQADIDEITNLGYDRYLDQQLNYESIDDSACEAHILAHVPNVSLTLQEINHIALSNSSFGSEAAIQAMIMRAAISKRQLYQRMTEFWHDHFHINSGTHLGHYLHYQREVIWAKSLGTFKDILSATANHGLMMAYLDNKISTANSVNVNYARELLELHTVGVNGGYTEEDIYQMADVFTGWGMEFDNSNFNYVQFKYTHSLHAEGTRTIMGESFPQSGKAQGDAVLSWLAQHPATIKYISDKLCQWFLGKPLTSQMYIEIANVWGAEGDLKAVLKIILSSSNIAFMNPIYKRPFHLLVGAIRQSGVNFTDGYWARRYLVQSGHGIGDWVQPDGFPNGFNYWSGGMVYRFNLMTHFCKGRVVSGVDFPEMGGITDGEKMAFLNNQFFLGELPVSDQIWIRRYIKGKTNHKQAAAIALCSPSYQWF